MIQEKTLRPLHPLPKAVSNRLVKLHREKWWASSTFNLFFSCLLSLPGERIELNWWKDQIRFAPCKPCYLKTGFGHFTFSPAVSLNKCTTHYKMHTEESRAERLTYEHHGTQSTTLWTHSTGLLYIKWWFFDSALGLVSMEFMHLWFPENTRALSYVLTSLSNSGSVLVRLNHQHSPSTLLGESYLVPEPLSGTQESPINTRSLLVSYLSFFATHFVWRIEAMNINSDSDSHLHVCGAPFSRKHRFKSSYKQLLQQIMRWISKGLIRNGEESVCGPDSAS